MSDAKFDWNIRLHESHYFRGGDFYICFLQTKVDYSMSSDEDTTQTGGAHKCPILYIAHMDNKSAVRRSTAKGA